MKVRMNAMTDVNPLGLDGFEFAEFTSPNPDAMKALIKQLGFTPTRRIRPRSPPSSREHRGIPPLLWRSRIVRPTRHERYLGDASGCRARRPACSFGA